MTEWDSILPLGRGDRVRIKSFSTYAPRHLRVLSALMNKVGTITFRLCDDIFVELKQGRRSHTIHLHIQDVERV